MSATWMPYRLRVRRRWRRALDLGHEKPGLLLRLADADGHVGWGELAPLAAVHGKRRDRRVLGEVARAPRAAADVGALAACVDFDELTARLDRADWARHPAVRFAVEMAWLGLDRERREQPDDVAARPARRASVAVNALVGASLEAVETFLATSDAAAWPAVKVKVGRRAPAVEHEGLRRLLDALAPHVSVRLDANRAFDLDQARAFLEGLPLDRFESLEEPLADPTELPELARATGARIALDETLREPCGEELASAPFVDAWIVKPAGIGVAATFDLDDRAVRAGKRLVVSSALESGLGLAFLARLALHLAAAEGAMGLGTESVFRGDPLRTSPLVVDGHVGREQLTHVPSGVWLDAASTLVPWLHAARPPLDPGATRLPRLAATPAPGVLALEGLGIDGTLAALARAGDDDAPFVPLLLGSTWPAARRNAAIVDAGALQVLTTAGLAAGPAPRPLGDARIGTLLGTSGTSGAPRLVAHAWGQHRDAAWGALGRLDLPPGARWLLSLPLHHVGGLAIVHRAGMGDLGLLVPGPGERLGDALLRLRPDVVSLVPTQLARLLDEPSTARALAGLRAVLVGGAPAPRGLRQRAVEAGIPLVVTYGMTETTAFVVASTNPAEAAEDGVAGRALPGVDVRVDGEGRIYVRTPTLALGTYGPRGLEPLADAEGWFATGDRGRLDGDVLHVLGRMDRMFHSGGVNVQPETIESVVGAWPEIEAVAVLPLEDPDWGARAAAIVALREPRAAADLTARARDELAPAERPIGWWPWPAELAPGSKVPYAALAAWLASRPERLD
ncbi:MAG: AMP-binding protein [Planctomycetota bacterium]